MTALSPTTLDQPLVSVESPEVEQARAEESEEVVVTSPEDWDIAITFASFSWGDGWGKCIDC